MFRISTHPIGTALKRLARIRQAWIGIHLCLSRIRAVWVPRNAILAHLPDRLVRDIGICPRDMEVHRAKMPSQTNRHPRL